ncbi:synaptogyrin 2 [Homo sapiens]|uniref:Synaptogyrin 2 n=1 Tax=Homo sapiens TaxID=9606 RepID=K7ENG9_HUMAN|nr:synaptogyrin 2 [Homo sapiens]KAI4051867.1 synaptogyrin 2 [Homo sapiens]
MESGAYGAAKAGGSFDLRRFLTQPQVVARAVCLEAEDAVSRDRTIALQPGQQEQDSISNNNKNPKGDSSSGRGQHLYTPSGSPLCVPLRRPPALPGPPLPAGLRLDRVLLHLW